VPLPTPAESLFVPEPTPPEPQTLTPAEAVAFALKHNPRLAAARAEVDRAGANVDAAGSPLLPHVNLLSRYIITSASQGAGAPGLTGVVLSKKTVGVNSFVQSELELQWTLIDFGRTAGRVGEAAARERAETARLRRSEQSVGLDAVTAYLSVLLAQADERTQRNALRWAEIFLADARVRRKAGTADRNDDLRAEVLVASEQDRLAEARRQVANAAAELNNALGRNPGLPVRVAPLSELPPLERPLAECLEIAARQRPEVAISRDNLAAAVAAREAKVGAFRPRIYAMASGGVVEGENVVTGLMGGSGIHFNVPLYEGGLRRSELHAAEAAIAVAGADAKRVFDDVALQVHLAYQDATTAAERSKLARPAVDQAREYLRLTLVKYKNGTATPADIADAEATATRAEDRYHSAAYEYLAALARLGYATGEGPEVFLPPAEAAPEPLPAPQELK